MERGSYCVIVRCPECEQLTKTRTNRNDICQNCGSTLDVHTEIPKHNRCPKKIICDALCEICNHFKIGELVYDQSILLSWAGVKLTRVSITEISRSRAIFINNGYRYAYNVIKEPILFTDENDIEFYKNYK